VPTRGSVAVGISTAMKAISQSRDAPTFNSSRYGIRCSCTLFAGTIGSFVSMTLSMELMGSRILLHYQQIALEIL